MTDQELPPFQSYLESKGVTEESASASVLSDAKAYESCYNWYISNQKVLPENAALASTIWVQKYALHDSNNVCLEKTPEDMWHRIAKVLAEEEVKTNKIVVNSLDEWESYFYDALEGFKYTPQGSGMFSLGNPYVNASASNCFVLPPPNDSLESIFDTAKSMARIYAMRGGVGHDISNLRPSGAKTNNAAKTSTGAFSFMDFFSYVTGLIGQCIEENQRVLTQRGYIPIKEVVSGDSVWTRKGWIRNLNTVYNGIKPVYKLTTKRGYDIIATDNHVLVTSDSGKLMEKQLGDFVVGDSIVTMPGTSINNIPYVKLNTVVSYDKGHSASNSGNRLNETVSLPDELTEELAYFVGYSFGDGCVERDKFNEPVGISLACSLDHPKVQDKLVKISNELFSYSMKIHSGDGRVNKVSLYSKKVGLYLDQNGLLKQKHDALVMPEAIWKSRTSVQMAFISGYFDADGYASGAKKGYVIASVHMPILLDMQKMLMAAGIVSHLSTEKRTGKEGMEVWKDLHSLSITGAASQTVALSLLTESIKISDKGFVAKRDNVLTPFTASSYSINSNNFTYINEINNLSTNSYRKLHEAGEITDNVVVSDEVVNIEYVGERPVYDLQLESEHLYLSEEMIVHNSGRRGALLLSIRVDHPDIFNFIRVKRDLDKKPFFDVLAENGVDINDYRWSAIADRVKSVSSANISVKLTDKFIHAVKNDLDFELYYDFEDNKYPRISRIVKAKDIWDELMRSAHESAEPGIFNWDHIVRESIPGKYGKGVFEGEEYDLTDTTSNPCGEIVMSPDSCCLGSFFLPKFVKNPYTSNAEFDWNEYKRIVAIGVRSQDNIKTWDLNKDFLLPVHKLSGKIARRLGLGNHGLADCLAMLGIKYNTQEGIDMAESIYKALKETAYSTSVDLAEEKGPIPIFDWAKHSKSPFIQRLPTELQKRIKTKGIRNIAMLTNAPTGSVSILSRNCSSGIEPVFMKSYTRNVKIPGTNNFEQRSIPHQAVADCIAAGGDTSVFIETYEITGPERVKMQAAIQQHIDHSISVTTNLPATATVEEVSALYMAAFDAGCKGFTIYRDGSRTGVLVSNDSNKNSKSMKSSVIERPKSTDIDIHKTKYKDKSYMILIGKVNGVPCEVFGGEEKGLSLPTQYKSASLTKKSRGQYSLSVQLSDDEDDILKVNNIGNLFPAGDIITLTRMISLSLRNGISISDIVEQLSKASSVLYDSPAVFARILKLYVPDEDILAKERSKGKKCPECGELLEFRRESGCVSEFCPSCTYSNSKCG
jgi:ribonucleoside-diphosphate reductase alpha chain